MQTGKAYLPEALQGEKMGFLFGGGFIVGFVVGIFEKWGRWTLYGKREQHNCADVVQTFFPIK